MIVRPAVVLLTGNLFTHTCGASVTKQSNLALDKVQVMMVSDWESKPQSWRKVMAAYGRVYWLLSPTGCPSWLGSAVDGR